VPLPLDEQLLRPWILPAVYARIQAGVEPFLAELRPATTLMLSFGGGSRTDDPSFDALEAYIRWVQQIVDRYGGVLIDVTLGDHGDFLYAAFGVPIATDDASTRAVSAALELCRPPPAFAMATMARIGIASGQVRCGPYGSTIRRTYGVMGDTTNLAARLMDVATPGTIICDEPTYQQTRQHWMFEVLTPVQIKGKSAPIAIYRPTGARQHPSAQRMHTRIGRQAEIDQLRHHLAQSAVGAHTILVVEGEAGIGKSHLISALLGMAHTHGVLAITGSSDPINQHPYQAWRMLIMAYLDLAIAKTISASTPEVWVQRAVLDLAPELAERSPLLNDLLDLALPDTRYTQTLDLAERAERLAELLAALLDSAQFVQPLALIIDDAQRLDLLSWQLTVRVGMALMQRRAGVLVFLALRPFDAGHPVRGQLKALLTLPHAHYLRLGALDDAAITAIAAQRLALSATELSEPVAGFIRERAGGNPLFAEELAAILAEQGLIEDDARLRFAANLLPATLQGLLLARIDRLTPDEQVALKIAAVIGQTFGYTILRFVYERLIPQQASAVVQILRSLAAKDFTWLETPEPNLTYRFRHALIQEAAYESLLYEQRRELHRAVAGWYEATLGASGSDIIVPKRANPLAPYAALLAYHYRSAEDAPNELRYTTMLGDQLYNISAFQDAAACFSRALDLIPNTDSGPHIEHGRLLGHMARTRLRLGDTPDATRLFIESLAVAEVSGDLAGASNACYELGALAARQVDPLSAQNYLERSLALAQMAGDVGAQAQVLDRLGGICIDRGDEAAALMYYQQAIALGRQQRQAYSLGAN
jgi:class 3 adenylate cyclase/tetratricopeptide (TPR) repeat protein